MHKSEVFWRDNYYRFDDVFTKGLVGLFKSTDLVTLAVICHDIGQVNLQ